MSPRCSYIRRVCGCMSASSAATEIMKTPRSDATSTRVVVRVRRVAMSRTSLRVREEARPRVAVHDLRELPHRLLLLARQRRRDVDDEAVVDVAAVLPAELRRALAADALHGAVLRAAGDAQRLAPVEGRDLDLGALQGLGDRERHLDLDVVALAGEDRRAVDVHDDEQVARWAAVRPWLALAGEPDLAALLDAGGDVRPVALGGAQPALAVAGGAGILDDRARAVAALAGLGDGEQPLALRLDAAALTARAHLRARARLGARAVARAAALGRRDDDRNLGAVDRLGERDLRLDLEVAAGLGPWAAPPAPAATAARPAALAAEQVGQDVAEAARVEAAEAAALTAAGRAEAAPVVGLALVGIAQQVVGLLDLLEALLGLLVVRVAVGVVLTDQLAMGLLDLVGRRRALDSEHLVGITLLGHLRPSMPLRRPARAEGWCR